MATDPYSTLGVPWGASRQAIERAFRKLALRYHPDRNPGDARAEARFKLISAAYQRLKESGWDLPPTVSSAAGRDETAQQSPPARPQHWPDGRPIHYPTRAEIDALLRDGGALFPRLRFAHTWVLRIVAYVYFVGVIGSVVMLVLLLLIRWIKSW